MNSFVLTGCSAGALASYLWVDEIQKQIFSVNPKVNYFGVLDSGFFLDYKNVKTGDNEYTI